MAVPEQGIRPRAVPLLATLLAWGRQGTAARIEALMAMASDVAALIASHDQPELLMPPQTGVVVWRPKNGELAEPLAAAMPPGSCSLTTVNGERWLRNVATNPNFAIGAFAAALDAALRTLRLGQAAISRPAQSRPSPRTAGKD